MKNEDKLLINGLCLWYDRLLASYVKNDVKMMSKARRNIKNIEACFIFFKE